MRRKRHLSQQDLRHLGVTPDLMLQRTSPDGRARLEQFTAEGSRRRGILTRRFTGNSRARGEEA